MQINHHGQIQPTLPGPDITDISRPFLVGSVGMEITVQQVGRDVETVIAVSGNLVFPGSDHSKAIVTHQTAYTSVTNR